MKQIITLLLMVTTLLTFTQKVMAVAPLLESGKQTMVHCEMENMNMHSADCATDMLSMDNCPNDCEMMSVVSVLHFIEHEQLLSFQSSLLQYLNLSVTPPYHFSETLYRPPFLS